MCPEHLAHAPLRREGGALMVELALCMTMFLVMMFGTMEVARMLFVSNTVQEVTRQAARAAAMTDFSVAADLAVVRRHALFRNAGDDGPLVLAPNLGPAQVRIEYLRADGTAIGAGSMPACPVENIRNCMQDPSGASCIRFVRASICSDASGACTPLAHQPMTGLLPGMAGPVPMAATVVKAETLGYRPGVNNCL
ncbi:TadE/TadG family type IV pilus assembly protein [Pseudoduganella dura]|nr:TadE/TadG family type IV pilus assembly protein [Pseudoduganella dura]GGX90644.1 hypothetical protein GCM10007386_21860 [Pseudoduganella dura]